MNDDDHSPPSSALRRAQDVGKQAARRGFDWPDADGALAKLDEELQELKQEMVADTDAAGIREEFGDLLFSMVNLARHLDVDAETVLEEAVVKFERRFQRVQSLADSPMETMELEELEGLWQQAKNW